MFGFEHTSEQYSTTSSYGPGAMDDELRYMQHGDELKERHRDQSEQMIACSVAPQMLAVRISIAYCLLPPRLRQLSSFRYYSEKYQSASVRPKMQSSELLPVTLFLVAPTRLVFFSTFVGSPSSNVLNSNLPR